MRSCQQFRKLDWRQDFVLVVAPPILDASAGHPLAAAPFVG
jgi:hypothetical protein